ISAFEGGLRRQRLWEMRLARMGERHLPHHPANGAASGRREGVRGSAQTLDRRADLQLAQSSSPLIQRLRTTYRKQRGRHLHRHDQPHGETTGVGVSKHVLSSGKDRNIMSRPVSLIGQSEKKSSRGFGEAGYFARPRR